MIICAIIERQWLESVELAQLAYKRRMKVWRNKDYAD